MLKKFFQFSIRRVLRQKILNATTSCLFIIMIWLLFDTFILSSHLFLLLYLPVNSQRRGELEALFSWHNFRIVCVALITAFFFPILDFAVFVCFYIPSVLHVSSLKLALSLYLFLMIYSRRFFHPLLHTSSSLK